MVNALVSLSRLLSVAVLVSAGAITAAGSAAQDPEPRVVNITAKRFVFEPAQIDAVVGERLRLLVRSADGVHGIEIKKFKINKEVPRGGAMVTIDFMPTEAGQFPILCSEYCGDDHDDMKGMLVVAASTAGTP